MSILLDKLLTQEQVSRVRHEATKKFEKEIAGKYTRDKQLSCEPYKNRREISELIRLLPQL